VEYGAPEELSYVMWSERGKEEKKPVKRRFVEKKDVFICLQA